MLETILREEIETFCDLEQRISEKEHERRTLATIDGLHRLFNEILKRKKIKDRWEPLYCHIFPFSTGAIEKSSKTQTEIILGVGIDGFFAKSPLRYSYCIRHMDDNFWYCLAEITKVGKAELTGSGMTKKILSNLQNKTLLGHKRSLIFSLARDYILLHQDEDAQLSTGSILITLPLETSFVEAASFYTDATALLYEINYLLYRQSYLLQRRILKNHLKTKSSNLPN